MSKIGVVIVAGGSGKRLGFSIPKALIEIRSREMFLYSLRSFQMCAELIDYIVLVTPHGMSKHFGEIIKSREITEPYLIVNGGKERQDSVREGLEALPKDTGIVLIHDAARPFITPDQIVRMIKLVNETGAATTASAVRDTLRKTVLEEKKRYLAKEVDRNDVWALGTPQGFEYKDIVAAHEKARSSGKVFSDDTSLLKKSQKIAIFEADFLNMKITWRSDLYLADILVDIWLERLNMKKEK